MFGKDIKSVEIKQQKAEEYLFPVAYIEIKLSSGSRVIHLNPQEAYELALTLSRLSYEAAKITIP